MLKRITAVVLFTVFLALPGCGSVTEPVQTAEPETTASSAEDIRIGMIFDTFVVERWIRDRDAFLATAQDLGATVDITNSNGDIKRQEEMIRYYTDAGFDAIVIVAIDSNPLVRAIRDARAKGVKVVSYDRLVRNAGTDLYVSFDNREIGELMAKEALTHVREPENDVLLVLGPKSDNNVLLIREGIEAVFESAPSVEVLDEAYIDDWDAELAARYVEEHLDLVREAEVIICGNDSFAGSISRTMSANRIPLPAIIGQDADLDACQRIVEGTQTMTVYKPVHLLAQEAARLTVAMAKGEAFETDGTLEDGSTSIAVRLLSPQAVTESNMEETVVESGFHTRDEVYLNVR